MGGAGRWLQVSLPTQQCCTDHFGVMDQCRPENTYGSCLQLFIPSPDLLISFPFESHRNMHYPPETSSIMLMARMVATIKQVQQVVLLSHCGCYSQGSVSLAWLSQHLF